MPLCKWPNPKTQWKRDFYNELYLKLLPLLPKEIHLKGIIWDDHTPDPKPTDPIIEITWRVGNGIPITLAYMYITDNKLILEKCQREEKISLPLYDPTQFNFQNIADVIIEIDNTAVQIIEDFRDPLSGWERKRSS